MSDTDPVWSAARLAIVVAALHLVALGVRTAVTGRSPLSRFRFVGPTGRQRAQPIRNGGCQALIGASVLIQQVPYLVPMPHGLGVALFGLALLVIPAGLGWFIIVRR